MFDGFRCGAGEVAREAGAREALAHATAKRLVVIGEQDFSAGVIGLHGGVRIFHKAMVG